MKKVQKFECKKSSQAVFYKKKQETLSEAVIRKARGTGKLNLCNHNLDKGMYNRNILPVIKL